MQFKTTQSCYGDFSFNSCPGQYLLALSDPVLKPGKFWIGELFHVCDADLLLVEQCQKDKSGNESLLGEGGNLQHFALTCLISPAGQVDHMTMSMPQRTPDCLMIYLSWFGCGVFIRQAHKHRRCHINQTSVCNCPANGMRSYRFMELSGRLIPDWDNRVLMTPFIVFFFFFSSSSFVSLQHCQTTGHSGYWCRNRLHIAVISCQYFLFVK